MELSHLLANINQVHDYECFNAISGWTDYYSLSNNTILLSLKKMVKILVLFLQILSLTIIMDQIQQPI